MIRIPAIMFFCVLLLCNSHAQDSTGSRLHVTIQFTPNTQTGIPSEQDYRNRRKWIGGITAAGFAGSFILLNSVWYDQYQRTGFHTFDDAREWQQMDKLGHAWTTYNITRATTAAWRWAGLTRNRSVVAGSITSLGYVTIIEMLDAYSAKWGWSWADVGANVFGTALFAAQDLQWQEQKVQLKFSSFVKDYPDDLQRRSDELFGHTVAERLFKDYNAQTYWLSANLKSFFPRTRLPAWLNVSVGYGSEGMFGGFDNIAFDHDGNRTFYRPDIKRYRQWYLAPDVDLTKIETN